MFDDGQPESRAALLPRPPLVRTVETFEHTRQVLLGNARTVILHLDQNFVQHVAEADAGLPTLLAVADRVDDQVDEHLPDVVFVGQHPEGRRQVVGPLDRNPDLLPVGLHLGLLGDLLGQRHHVESLQVELVHAAFEFRNGVEVVDDVDQTVDALLGAFEVFAVDQFVLQPSVQQRRNISLDIEYRGFQFVGHVAQILLAEALGLFQPGDLPVVGVGPGRQLLADVLDALVLQFREDLIGVHVARKHDRIDRLEFVSHVLADDEQRRERHHDEHPDRRAERDPPFDMLYNHTHGDDRRGEQGDPQRRALLCLDVYHRLTSCSFASAGRCICRRCRIRGSRPNRLRCGKNSCARRCRE